MTNPSQPLGSRSATARTALVALLLLALSSPLILQSWSAPFNGYDDPAHVAEHPLVQRDDVAWRELLTPVKGETYFPLTLITYRIDRALFGSWMPNLLGTWAPGARITNMLYHTLAAFVLWRLMLALRLSSGISLFVAAAFAAHPMACESVAWLSERKNVLSALFGILSLLAWVKGDGKIWRVPATLALWLLALLGKPNALGLLPLFAIFDLCGGVNGLHGERPMNWFRPREWIGIGERLILFAVLAGAIIRINVRGFQAVILPPPGGSIFTALLTDLEIVSRYFFNTLVPIRISAVYLVIPVESVTDARVCVYGALLIALFVATLHFASNRRLVIFAWLWILAALGTHLNLMSLTYLMQDRYFYLSTPGLLLLVALVAPELFARLKIPSKALLYTGATLVLCFALLASLRSAVWKNTYTLFGNAVSRQPDAAYAHYGFAQALREQWFLYSKVPNADPLRVKLLQDKWHMHLKIAAECPDATRIPDFIQLLAQLGEIAAERGDFVAAERYYRRALQRAPETSPSPVSQGEAHRGLAMIRFREGKPAEALTELDRAIAVFPSDGARIERAALILEFARARRAAGHDVSALLRRARTDLEKALKNPQAEKDARPHMETLQRLEAP